jgi:hypothetical protein
MTSPGVSHGRVMAAEAGPEGDPGAARAAAGMRSTAQAAAAAAVIRRRARVVGFMNSPSDKADRVSR